MGAIVDFEWDSRDLALWRGGKVEAALARAARLAGNQAIKVAKTSTIAYVRSKKFLREHDVAKALPLVMPGRKDALANLVWTEKVSGAPMPVSKFPNIQTKTGVSVRINVGAGTKRIRSAFRATLGSGHLGVFRRKGKARLPIAELWTSRISDVMQDPGAVDGVQGQALQRFQTAFQRGLARELAKLKRKGEA